MKGASRPSPPQTDPGAVDPGASVSFALLHRLGSPTVRNTPDGLDRLDALMLAVARDCDKAAFAALFNHFGPLVKSWLMRSGSSPSAADDLVQDTFVLMWHKAAQFDPTRARVAAWLFTIARNLRIDRARKAARAQAGVTALGYETPEIESSAEDDALAGERDARVRKAMDSLSPAQATVLKLSFFSEKPHAQIARELNIPLGTVKSRVRLAMAKIRAILEQEL